MDEGAFRKRVDIGRKSSCGAGSRDAECFMPDTFEIVGSSSEIKAEAFEVEATVGFGEDFGSVEADALFTAV